MSDPFEEPSPPSFGAPPPGQLREPSVQQAVGFLNDPRVKAEHPSKALHFLRQKGITDEELREAYRRCGIPFPNAVTPQFGQPYPTAVPQPLAPYRQPTRPSWVSVFLGITAAAGIYTAVREVLRRYVVPLYFPDAARIAEERRRREEHSFQAQEQQIADLRERIQDLLASSEKTQDRVDNLSKSISSSIALREQELSQASELRDAIRQLSHSVTASAGTDTSHLARASADVTEDGSYQHLNHAHKLGSLAYSGKGDSSILRTSVEVRSDDVKDIKAADPQEITYTTLGNGPHVDGFETKGVKEGAKENADGVDEFMAIPPAQVEESWRTSLSHAPGSTEAASGNRKAVQEAEETTAEPSEKVEDAVVTSVTASTMIVPDDEDDEDQVQPVGTHHARSAAASAFARKLFQTDVMQEAANRMADRPLEDGTGPSRIRPLSMPQMDTPLSDAEC